MPKNYYDLFIDILKHSDIEVLRAVLRYYAVKINKVKGKHI